MALAAATPAAAAPALWRVSDEDTTIYLFGTVHALPPAVEWYGGPVAQALETSDEVVTELAYETIADPQAQQTIGMTAILPPGRTLRSMMSAQDRARYEAALEQVGLDAEDLDRFKPWFVAMTLGSLPLMRAGYEAGHGVETIIESRARPATTRTALETLEGQLALLDGLPTTSQIAYLVDTVRDSENIAPRMGDMVVEWQKGDADALARLMNQGLADKTLAETLLYRRNVQWADWVAKRMARPGTVFVAVGAGHLAGRRSVQRALRKHGFAAVRVQ